MASDAELIEGMKRIDRALKEVDDKRWRESVDLEPRRWGRPAQKTLEKQKDWCSALAISKPKGGTYYKLPYCVGEGDNSKVSLAGVRAAHNRCRSIAAAKSASEKTKNKAKDLCVKLKTLFDALKKKQEEGRAAS